MIFTDWVCCWDPVSKLWHKVHVSMDSEKIAQHFMREALKYTRKRKGKHTTCHGGLILHVSNGVSIEIDKQGKPNGHLSSHR